MIYDKLANIGQYKGIHKHLDTAIDYILANKLEELPLGKTEIAGSHVYVNCMECEAGPLESKGYELHKHYMDIQIDLEGAERIYTGDSSQMTINSYNPDTDYASVDCPTLADCLIGPGNFILCMAGEPHKPGVAAGEDSGLKKCVFKVHI